MMSWVPDHEEPRQAYHEPEGTSTEGSSRDPCFDCIEVMLTSTLQSETLCKACDVDSSHQAADSNSVLMGIRRRDPGSRNGKDIAKPSEARLKNNMDCQLLTALYTLAALQPVRVSPCCKPWDPGYMAYASGRRATLCTAPDVASRKAASLGVRNT